MYSRERVKVGAKGQIVIPKIFRKLLRIHPGKNITIGLKNNEVIIEDTQKDIVSVFERIASMKKIKEPAIRTHVNWKNAGIKYCKSPASEGV